MTLARRSRTSNVYTHMLKSGTATMLKRSKSYSKPNTWSLTSQIRATSNVSNNKPHIVLCQCSRQPKTLINIYKRKFTHTGESSMASSTSMNIEWTLACRRHFLNSCQLGTQNLYSENFIHGSLSTVFKIKNTTIMNANSIEFHLFIPFHGQLQRFHCMGSFGNILRRSPNPKRHFASRHGGESVITAHKLPSNQCKQVARLGPRILPHCVMLSILQSMEQVRLTKRLTPLDR